MTVSVTKNAVNLREELASLRNQGGYQEQQFYFDGLVTNGTFDSDTDWTKGTGWTISGGVASCDGSSTNFNSVVTVFPANTLTVITFDAVVTSGYVRFNSYFAWNNILTSGTYTFFVETPVDYDVLFQSVGFIGSIDNISVFEVDANNDVVHRMPKGWIPKDFYEDGLLQREGSAHDYEVVYDGFDYFVKPTVAPSATTQTRVIGVKA